MPIRLNPDAEGEVVWCRRLDPARARIENIPTPETGYRFGDVVLNDGVPNGSRLLRGVEVPVFDAIERLETSALWTFRVAVHASGPEVVEELMSAADQSGFSVEDWTRSIRYLCRECSEGKPHEGHHQAPEQEWSAAREVGLAATDRQAAVDLLTRWASGGAGRAFELVEPPVDA